MSQIPEQVLCCVYHYSLSQVCFFPTEGIAGILHCNVSRLRWVLQAISPHTKRGTGNRSREIKLIHLVKLLRIKHEVAPTFAHLQEKKREVVKGKEVLRSSDK